MCVCTIRVVIRFHALYSDICLHDVHVIRKLSTFYTFPHDQISFLFQPTPQRQQYDPKWPTWLQEPSNETTTYITYMRYLMFSVGY